MVKEINMTDRKALVEAAVAARDRVYSPYSRFCVGAALLCADGEVIIGANVENSSYGGTICAERVALTSAVVSGKRDFKAIAIVGAHCGEEINAICAPCGICRQFIAEFCDKDFEILLYDGKEIVSYTLEEILPMAFTKNDLGV